MSNDKIEVAKVIPMGTGIVHNFKVEDKRGGLVYKDEGITMVLPSTSLDKLSTACGTKFFLSDGTELHGVHSFEVKPTGADGILSICLSFALHKVAYPE